MTPNGSKIRNQEEFDQAAKLAKIQNIHPHSLRHTYVTHATRVVSIHDVKDLVHHKDIRTTDGYRHSDQEAMAEAAISAERFFEEMLDTPFSPMHAPLPEAHQSSA